MSFPFPAPLFFPFLFSSIRVLAQGILLYFATDFRDNSEAPMLQTVVC